MPWEKQSGTEKEKKNMQTTENQIVDRGEGRLRECGGEEEGEVKKNNGEENLKFPRRTPMADEHLDTVAGEHHNVAQLLRLESSRRLEIIALEETRQRQLGRREG